MSDKVWHNPFGLLSDLAIKKARAEGLIVIEPFEESHLGTSSYDVRIGRFLWRERHPLTERPIYNIYDAEDVSRVWIPDQATLYSKLVKFGHLPADLPTFAPDDLVIMIAPGETILAHTIEAIGGRKFGDHGITTKMYSRSSIGRSLLGICKCAGQGDVGFTGVWTLEVTSFASRHWIPIRVGTRVGQIQFTAVENVEQTYGDRGAYQTGSDLATIISAWKPDSMLPKLRP